MDNIQTNGKGANSQDYQDGQTDMFNYFWVAAAEKDVPSGQYSPESLVDAIHVRGAQWMLDEIRASLENYPNMGGDIVVMREVERLIAGAKS